MNDNQTTFEQHVKQQLDASLNTIDALTQSQLTQARHKALAHATKKHSVLWGWLGAFVSTIAVAMVMITIIPTNHQGEILPSQSVPEWVIMSETEELDLYNDLEFYQWLDNTDFNG